MKKLIVIVLYLVLVFSMAGCGKNSEANVSAPPAIEFSTADEAVQTIKTVKAAGPEKMPHPDDFKLYDKDYICLLKEVPLADFDQAAIMLVSQGIVTYYENEQNRAVFYWDQGYEQTEELTERYSLERYEDTKFFFGKSGNDIFIYWWENGDQFNISYTADTNISPENVIENLEVEKYDLGK